ncbi:MAG: 4Fe-4S dicluster domain-containing protein [Methanomassiliicoccaceae archaeon]|jgi:heterodisulfide reductase subunit C|nr:4Fe-4S dicluster domain-containing protein [Methanomassiliicoccaceae archaeon]
MSQTAGDVASLYSLSSCIGCGKCDSVCPSGRNGGVYPYDIISAILDGDPSTVTSDLQIDAWKCLMCHRCAMACPRDLDITGAIRSLRYDSVSSGEMPKRFRTASAALAAEGRAFPVNDIVNQRRQDLGLDKIPDGGQSVNELKIIISRTGFRNE